MKKLRIWGTVLGIALLSLVWATPALAAHTSSDICVNPHDDECYSTIQAAVSAAPNGATINVARATYPEQVTISGKALTLIGHDATINATGQPHGIYVVGAATVGTVISDFTVINAQFEGVLLQSTSDLTVRDMVIEDNDTNYNPSTMTCANEPFPGLVMDCGEGFHLMGVSNSRIVDNTSEQNVGGLLLSDETGPTFNNLIADNNISNNTKECGITLASHTPVAGFGVYDNVITHNISIGNGAAGIGMFAPIPGTATYDNLVSDNIVKNNGLGGIDIHSHIAGQNLNGNSIIGNTISGNAPDFGTGDTVPVGIVVFADITGGAAPILDTTITNNTIFDESIDVYVGTAQTALSLHLNNLLGGSGVIGVDNASASGTVEASANYWGCATGPGTSNCTTVEGSVDFTPWLKERHH